MRLVRSNRRPLGLAGLAGLAGCLLLASFVVVPAQTEETDDEEIEIERALEIELRLIGVERLPRPGSTAIARSNCSGVRSAPSGTGRPCGGAWPKASST